LIAPSSVGVLCTECRADLAENLVIAPEQLVARVEDPTRAAFVDAWGRVHLVDAQLVIGRDLDSGIAIHTPSVSRVHARLQRDDAVWTLTDVESTNGTFVDDRRVETTVIHAGERVRFGDVSVFFLDHIEEIPRAILVDSETVRPGSAALIMQQLAPAPPTSAWSEFQLHEPTGGGGGIVQIDGKQIQLTLAQLELVVLLTDRMDTETDRVPELRGFVSVPELLGKISLEVPVPRDAHVRQLIRRVRRAFIKADVGDLIESRYGLGYRIRLRKMSSNRS